MRGVTLTANILAVRSPKAAQVPDLRHLFAGDGRLLREGRAAARGDGSAAALNPTNPCELASPWERERTDLSLKEVLEIQEGEERRQYTVAFPLAIKSESCLSCHSEP